MICHYQIYCDFLMISSIKVVVNHYHQDPHLDLNIMHRLDEYEQDVRECLIFSI